MIKLERNNYINEGPKLCWNGCQGKEEETATCWTDDIMISSVDLICVAP